MKKLYSLLFILMLIIISLSVTKAESGSLAAARSNLGFAESLISKMQTNPNVINDENMRQVENYIIIIGENLSKSSQSDDKNKLLARYITVNRNYEKFRKEIVAIGGLNKAKFNLDKAEKLIGLINKDPDKNRNIENVVKLEKHIDLAKKYIATSPDSSKKNKLLTKLMDINKKYEEIKLKKK